MPTTVLFTGFPGFLGTALLPRTLRRAPEATAVALVQERWLDQARRTLARLEDAEPAIAGRTRLVVGDITRPGLDLDDDEAAALRGGGPLEIFHLAAVYDLSVPAGLAWSVNVEGTRHVVAFARSAEQLVRLQYVSTCYVSGSYPGIFAEDDLELGQHFSNHYEHTKHEAERVVVKARNAGMPVTIYRPSIVVGDSRTGETQKYDGPYYALQLIARQGRIAVMPLPGDPARVQFNLVPSDFVVDAIAALAPHPAAENRTVALASPRPPSVLEMCEAFAAHTGKKLKVVPVPGAVSRFSIDHVPGVGRLFKLPSSTLDYLTHPTVYDVTATTALLDEVGVHCPTFAEHVGAMVAFHREHPDVGSAAMV